MEWSLTTFCHGRMFEKKNHFKIKKTIFLILRLRLMYKHVIFNIKRK